MNDYSVDTTNVLNEHYFNHGVGDSVNHKYRFWKSQYPDVHITHVTTEEQFVNAIEYFWLSERFPSVEL